MIGKMSVAADHLSHHFAIPQAVNTSYFTHPLAVRITTPELRNEFMLNLYIQRGFKYIRRLHYNYNYILREPTDGCLVELTKRQDVGSIPIQSAAAKKLIRRVAYF